MILDSGSPSLALELTVKKTRAPSAVKNSAQNQFKIKSRRIPKISEWIHEMNRFIVPALVCLAYNWESCKKQTTTKNSAHFIYLI